MSRSKISQVCHCNPKLVKEQIIGSSKVASHLLNALVLQHSLQVGSVFRHHVAAETSVFTQSHHVEQVDSFVGGKTNEAQLAKAAEEAPLEADSHLDGLAVSEADHDVVEAFSKHRGASYVVVLEG